MSNIKQFFSYKRTELMGIAIVMVLLYHLYSICSINSLNMFRHWYAGVDLFMALSGWGLCYSYKKHSLPNFYLRRLFRILPLYIFQVIIANVILSTVQDGDYHDLAKHVIEEMLTLFNMSIGGDFGNWYTSAILLLYLLFPILYFIVGRLRFLSYAIMGLVACAIIHHYPDMQWQYNCFLSRVPAFLLGIGLYCSNEEKKKDKLLLILVTIILLNISYSYDISNYTTTSFITLISIVSIASVYKVKTDQHSDSTIRKKTIAPPIMKPIGNKNICSYIRKLLVFCGKYSYELFLSNRLTALSIILLTARNVSEHNHVAILTCFYAFFTIFYGFVFIIVNQYIQRFIAKYVTFDNNNKLQ